VPEYSTTIEGYNIKNSYTPGKTSLSATKVWDDGNNQDGLRPQSIQVQLYANNQKVGEAIELSEENHWTTTWNELAEKAKGQAITYRVEELTKVAGYTSEVKQTKDGNIVITNTHVPETKEVSGQKTWEDNENQDGKRPTTITVNLLADGQPIQHKEVSEKDDWRYRFTNLPKYRDGQEIIYTVTEDNVPEYSTT
ncbi:Cna B-type domain-containing protein, partial [Enterococcus faecium]